MDEYIKYLQKATAKNLGPADYAIMKIYADERENEEIEELRLSISQIKGEYEDFKTEVRENYAKEVAKATDDLKAKYEAELKTKEAEMKKLVSQKDELAKKLREIETAKETANNEIAELQKRLQNAAEKLNLQIQASADATAKELRKKDTIIQNLESKLETAKQNNKQLAADAKSELQKVQTEAEQKIKTLQANWTAKYNANIETLVTEIDKNNVPTSKSFREKWIKRGKEL
jgi:chromosome segregation ATPase